MIHLLSILFIYLLSTIFVLSVLVFFHELGHFVLAKLFGVRVERFSIGFPPRLFGVKYGDTDYCISAIPLGGYVKMTGVVDESLDTSTLTGEPYEFASKKTWQKILILIGGVIMNLLLAWFILGGLLHFNGDPILPTTLVGNVVEESAFSKAGFQVGDNIETINGHAVKTWNDVQDGFISNLGSKIVFTINRKGKQVEIVLDKDLIKSEKSEQIGIYPLVPAVVGKVIPETPASKTGLKMGDKIVSVEGKSVESWDEMTQIIRANPDVPLSIELERNNEIMKVNLTPEATDEIDANGVSHFVGKIGIGIFYTTRKLGVFPAMEEGLNRTIFFTSLTLKGLGWLVTRKISAKETIGGPIMITKIAGDLAKRSFSELMKFIAHLSIMLAIVNVLPIPALDGGHITIILIEHFRKKPLATKTKLKIQQWGMAILFVFIIFVMYNDISKLL